MIFMEKNCLTCSKIFYKQGSDSKKYWAVKKYCSIKCSGTNFKKGQRPSDAAIASAKARSGNKSPSWKGGSKYMTLQGYVTVYAPGYPDNRCLEHRYVMEKHLKRKLLKTEHVHHLNGDKIDNRIENLVIIDPKEHGIAHARQRWHNEPVNHLH